MINSIQNGKVINVTLAGTVASGAVVKAGSVIGVAVAGGVSGDVIAVDVNGVFEVDKKTTDVITQGEALYWDAVNSEMTETSTDNTFAGYAWEAANGSATTVKIKLNF